MAAGDGDHAADRLQQLVLVVELGVLDLLDHAVALDVDLVGTVDHDLADGAVPEQVVEWPVADGGEQDVLQEIGPLGHRERELVFLQEPVHVEPDSPREGVDIAHREIGVFDLGEAIPVEARQLHDARPSVGRVRSLLLTELVGPAAAGSGHPLVQADAPTVHETDLEERAVGDHGRDHELRFGHPHPDREPLRAGGQRGEVRLDVVAVTEAHEALAVVGVVAGILIEPSRPDRSKRDVFDVGERDPGQLAMGAAGVDGIALADEADRLGLAFDDLPAEEVNADIDPLGAERELRHTSEVDLLRVVLGAHSGRARGVRHLPLPAATES